MLKYRSNLKQPARTLRSRMTDAEQLLWSRLRRKQLLGVQFYRQKPLGPYVVDFYAPSVKLVIEVDGSQHLEEERSRRDKERDAYLGALDLRVLRCDDLQVLRETEAVLGSIYGAVAEALDTKNPPCPPFSKGGVEDGTPAAQKGPVEECPPSQSTAMPDVLPYDKAVAEALDTENPPAPLYQKGGEVNEVPPPARRRTGHSPPLEKGG